CFVGVMLQGWQINPILDVKLFYTSRIPRANSMTKITRLKLSGIMFLVFFIGGAGFVTLCTYVAQNLNASGLETANVFSTQSWGAIIAPFIIGLIADRFFNAERILGVLHLVGAVLMYQLYQAPDVGVFYPFAFAYMVLYMPTLAL